MRQFTTGSKCRLLQVSPWLWEDETEVLTKVVVEIKHSNEVKDSMPGSVVPLAIFFLCNVICTYIMLANVCTAVVISLKINFILRNWRRAGKNEACHWHLMKELFWWFEEEKSFQLFTIVHLQEQVKHCSSINEVSRWSPNSTDLYLAWVGRKKQAHSILPSIMSTSYSA